MRRQQAELTDLHAEGAKTVQAAAATVAQLRQQLVEATTAPATEMEKAKAGFKVPAGEESYTHVYVTHKNGVALPTPQVEPYHPNVWKQLAKSPNIIQGEVFHKGK